MKKEVPGIFKITAAITVSTLARASEIEAPFTL